MNRKEILTKLQSMPQYDTLALKLVSQYMEGEEVTQKKIIKTISIADTKLTECLILRLALLST